MGSQHTRSIAPIFRSNDKTHWIASTNNSNPTKILKIIFPTFDGTSPKMWINKCNKYFNINQMSDEQKLYMISIHLEGRVDIWFHDYQEINMSFTWDQFIIDVCTRFQEGGS